MWLCGQPHCSCGCSLRVHARRACLAPRQRKASRSEGSRRSRTVTGRTERRPMGPGPRGCGALNSQHVCFRLAARDTASSNKKDAPSTKWPDLRTYCRDGRHTCGACLRALITARPRLQQIRVRRFLQLERFYHEDRGHLTVADSCGYKRGLCMGAGQSSTSRGPFTLKLAPHTASTGHAIQITVAPAACLWPTCTSSPLPDDEISPNVVSQLKRRTKNAQRRTTFLSR
jgi:hypothetical protein